MEPTNSDNCKHDSKVHAGCSASLPSSGTQLSRASFKRCSSLVGQLSYHNVVLKNVVFLHMNVMKDLSF